MKTARTNRGFTLVELLVVIGLIALLIGLLLPTISSVRRTAQAADTGNLIRNLANGVERYQLDFRSFPGPLPDTEIARGQPAAGGTLGISSTQNMMLGLFGGLGVSGNTRVIAPASFGRGPLVNQGGVGVTLRPPTLELPKAGNLWNSQASFYGQPEGDRTNILLNTSILEPVDSFGDAMPIVYMRATVGPTAPLSVWNKNDLITYAGPNVFTGPDANVSDVNYFGDPSSRVSGTATAARQQRGYMIISAGLDRVYGTTDDITSFGSILP